MCYSIILAVFNFFNFIFYIFYAMENISYRAYVTEQIDEKFASTIKILQTDNLPQGDCLIRVHYSSLNYKDALSATGNKGVTRNYPHTPGIDAAGEIAYSTNNKFKIG
ncbi:MAG: quinone oxidoreductase, YhdH/YhfP family, partial [Bacteroidetes bacterium]|nr:quinone oxidoreductase, YhdH/YhfP family [Bacteroidota bacterium]